MERARSIVISKVRDCPFLSRFPFSRRSFLQPADPRTLPPKTSGQHSPLSKWGGETRCVALPSPLWERSELIPYWPPADFGVAAQLTATLGRRNTFVGEFVCDYSLSPVLPPGDRSSHYSFARKRNQAPPTGWRPK